MTGLAVRWALGLLLLICMGVTSDAAGLTITSMEWSGAVLSIALTICTEVTLKSNITLTVTSAPSNSDTFPGEVNAGNTKCADFEGVTYPYSELTKYQLEAKYGLLNNDTTQVEFGLGGTIISCPNSKFQRFILSDGEVEGNPCLFNDLDSNACYVSDNPEVDPITFKIVDTSNTNIQVKVPRAAFSDAENDDGFITGDVFTYDDFSFTLVYDYSSDSLVELLKSTDDGGSWDVTSCTDDVCVYSGLTKGTEEYTLCGVFTQGGSLAAKSDDVIFQDLNLIVDSTDQTIDFHFSNLKDDKKYQVYSLDSNKDVIESIALDCSHISDGICNGFFDKTGSESFIAVAYNDADYNKVIAPLTQRTLMNL